MLSALMGAWYWFTPPFPSPNAINVCIIPNDYDTNIVIKIKSISPTQWCQRSTSLGYTLRMYAAIMTGFLLGFPT